MAKLKHRKIGSQWYEILGHANGRAGYRSFGRDSWGIYFRDHATNKPLFCQQPGDELRTRSKADAIAIAIAILDRQYI